MEAVDDGAAASSKEASSIFRQSSLAASSSSDMAQSSSSSAHFFSLLQSAISAREDSFSFLSDFDFFFFDNECAAARFLLEAGALRRSSRSSSFLRSFCSTFLGVKSVSHHVTRFFHMFTTVDSFCCRFCCFCSSFLFSASRYCALSSG